MSDSHFLHYENIIPKATDDGSRNQILKDRLATTKDQPSKAQAQLYKEIAWYYVPTLEHPHNYLILHRSDQSTAQNPADPQDAHLHLRTYRLLQSFNPHNNTTTSPHLLTIEITPSDAQDMHDWHTQEHFPLVSTYEGHHRSWRYQLDPSSPSHATTDPQAAALEFLVVHEVDDVSTTFSQANQAGAMTPWTVRVMQASRGIRTRAWRRVGEGEGGGGGLMGGEDMGGGDLAGRP